METIILYKFDKDIKKSSCVFVKNVWKWVDNAFYKEYNIFYINGN